MKIKLKIKVKILMLFFRRAMQSVQFQVNALPMAMSAVQKFDPSTLGLRIK